jgi:hypothetical protein
LGRAPERSIKTINVKKNFGYAVKITKEKRNRFSKSTITWAKILGYKSTTKGLKIKKKRIITVTFSLTQNGQILKIKILHPSCTINKAKKIIRRWKAKAESWISLSSEAICIIS